MKVTGWSYRMKQQMYAKQYTDVCVDSRINKYFMAIEVKAKRGQYALNFKDDFTIDKETGEHQLDRQVEFAKRTGRIPYIVLFCRMGRGKSNIIYVFSSLEMQKLMHKGKTSILSKEFELYNKENELWKILNGVI